MRHFWLLVLLLGCGARAQSAPVPDRPPAFCMRVLATDGEVSHFCSEKQQTCALVHGNALEHGGRMSIQMVSPCERVVLTPVELR